jgi:hypothetical protein
MRTSEAILSAFNGFASIAALTWFFSSRPRLFLRVFVPRNELFAAGRCILRGDEFRHGTRLIAGLQFVAACVFGLVGLWLEL